MPQPAPRIVIVGGGFAGLYAASYLGRSELAPLGADILLVDQKNYFTFTPLLAEVAAGNLSRDDVVVGYRTLARRYGFRFLQGVVDGLDAERQVIHTAHQDLPYDYLVLAPGAEPTYFGNEALEKHSCSLVSVDDAMAIHDRVVHAMEAASRVDDPMVRACLLTIVVAGAGPAGVEMAGELHHFANDVLGPFYPGLPRVRVIIVSAGDRILPGFDDHLARQGLDALRRLGIEVHLDTMVKDAQPGQVMIEGPAGAAVLMAGSLIWTAGTRPAEWLSKVKLPTDRGSLQVEETLQVVGHPTVFAAGDVAGLVDARSGRPYPRVAPIALSQGTRAAANIEALIFGRPLERYQAHHAGKIVSLGRGIAFVELLGFRITGRVAWLFYRTAYLLKLVGLKNKARVVVSLLFNRLFDRDIAASSAAPQPVVAAPPLEE